MSMSYTISNELYDKLINSNLEENLKNELINLSNSNIDNIKSNFYMIRILSYNEYEKYIKNGTCDGAISSKNTAVFHFDNTIFTYRQKITGWHTQQGVLAAPVYIRLETTQDNNVGNASFFHIAGKYDIQLWEINPSSNDYFMYYQQLNHSKTSTHLATARHSYYGNWPDMIYSISAYRPVFQYKDNNKSENVFY